MSIICGGNEHWTKDIFWWIVFFIRQKKDICPRCGANAFEHGFHPRERHYCTKCGLWND